MESVPRRRRRWLQFSLRAWLVATIALAAGVGWWMQSALRQRDAVKTLRDLGFEVFYDYQYDSRWASGSGPNGSGAVLRAESPWAWLGPLYDEDLLHTVYEVSLASGTTCRDTDLAHLVALPKIKRLSLGSDVGTEHGMSHVGQLRRLEELLLWDATATDDAALEQLRGLNKLRVFRCTDSQISGDSFQVFAGWPNLQGLWLCGSSGIDDRAMEALRNLRKLRLLCLSHSRTTIADAGCEALGKVKSLTSVSITSPLVTDRGLAALCQLGELHYLGICLPGVSPHGYLPIGNLKRLRQLDICRARVDRLDFLARLDQLQSLDVTFSILSSQAFADLGQITELDSLNLVATNVTDDDLAHLRGLQKLRHLELLDTTVTSDAVESLKELRALNYLNFVEYTRDRIWPMPPYEAEVRSPVQARR